MTRLSTRLSPISFARASAWGVGLVGLVPVRAFACSVCGGGNPANRFAGFLWLRARGASEFVERNAARPALVDPTSRDNGEPHPPPVPAA